MVWICVVPGDGLWHAERTGKRISNGNEWTPLGRVKPFKATGALTGGTISCERLKS